ncbi:MAG: cell division regulator GpsB [Bacilli bacterium]
MITDKIFLTPNDILEKEFKIDARGYRPQEVDKFLDIVIRDYSEFMTILKRLDVENQNLTNDNYKLKNEIRKLKENIDIIGSSKGVTNVDVIKRISELEKIVYGDE